MVDTKVSAIFYKNMLTLRYSIGGRKLFEKCVGLDIFCFAHIQKQARNHVQTSMFLPDGFSQVITMQNRAIPYHMNLLCKC
jgi:hypothetical protein